MSCQIPNYPLAVSCQEEETNYPTDIGLWPNKVNDKFLDFWVEKGNNACGNSSSKFEMSAVKEGDRTRQCTSNLFTGTHSLTGEKLDLSCLYYSEVYCFPCKLLSDNESVSQLVLTTGSTDRNEFNHRANRKNTVPF